MRKSCLLTMLVLAMAWVMSGCEKFALDQQMDDLCRRDGGVKVYETVVLPRAMFDQLGDPFPGWPDRAQEERLGPSYRYMKEIVDLKRGNALKGEGELRKYVERIYRRADGKLMGEAISYGRSGGDFIAYAHPTSKHCPIHKSANETLIRSVFLMNGE